MPISRKSCALKAGIRALGTTHPSNSHHRCLLLSFISALPLFYCEPKKTVGAIPRFSRNTARSILCVDREEEYCRGEKKPFDILRIYSESTNTPDVYYFNKFYRIERNSFPFAFLYALIYFVDVSSINYEKMTERECFHGQPFASMT